MTESFCPDCDSRIQLGRTPRVNDHVSCPSCGAYLQVVSITPIELDWAYDEDDAEGDYEYEYDGDDYDEADY